MANNLPILIVGSGLAGLCMAVALKQSGINVELVSPNFPSATSGSDFTALYGSGRTTALLQSSHTFLDRISVWDAVKDQATPLKTMCLIDDQMLGQKPIEVNFSPTDLQTDASNVFDAFGFNVSNTALTNALVNQISALAVPIHNTSVVGIDIGTTKARARCANGTVLEASLLVAADGSNSKIRALSRIDVEEHVFDQLALTMVIKHQRPHENVSTEFQKKQGPLTLVPLDTHHSSIVWVHRKQAALDLLSIDHTDIAQRLEKEMHNKLGHIEIIAGPGKFPVISRRAKSMQSRRIALIAEAAHAMPPIGAQGLNTSLMDVAHLASLLIKAVHNGQKLSDEKAQNQILEAYEQARGQDIHKRFKAVNTLNYMVTTQNIGLMSVRQLGLRTNANSEAVRNFFVARGMMWEKDLPA